MALAIDADGDGQVGFENLGHRVNDALSMIEDESMTSSQVLLPLGDDSVSEISMLLPPELARGGCQVLNLVVEEKPPPRRPGRRRVWRPFAFGFSGFSLRSIACSLGSSGPNKDF